VHGTVPLDENGEGSLFSACEKPLEKLGIGKVLGLLDIEQRVQAPKDTGQISIYHGVNCLEALELRSRWIGLRGSTVLGATLLRTEIRGTGSLRGDDFVCQGGSTL